VELPKILRFSYYISAMAGVAISNLARSWGLPMPIIKSHAEERVFVAHGLGELSKILWFHISIYTMAEAKDFKFATQLGFAKPHHNTTPRGKVGVAMGWGISHIFGVPL